MRRHTPKEQFREAFLTAKEHGMFVVDKGDRFLLYRVGTVRNVYLGMRSDPSAFLGLVKRCAASKK